MSSFSPTDEQQAIIHAVRSSSLPIMIRALAGCGKTSTLQLIAENISSTVPVLYIVFNSKNKKEAEARMPKHVTTVTVNGLGHGAWQRAIGKRLTLDDRKLGKIITAEARTSGLDLGDDLWSECKALVTKAMQVGLVPAALARPGLVPDTDAQWEALREDASPSPALIALARQVLTMSIRQAMAGTVSFDDQIYCSALLGGQFPRYPVVMVDEAQDQSKLNAIMIARAAAGRLIIVGDEKQAIYAWRGADADAMANLRKLRPQWIELPLATTFRCCKEVVARNKGHAAGFTAWGGNPQGQFLRFPISNPYPENGCGDGPLPSWCYTDILRFCPSGDATPKAILCRNNAPLLSLAFKLIRAGVGVVMAGREIGRGLTALSRKLGKADEVPIAEHIVAIREWSERECGLALANANDEKAEGISDRAECLLAVAGAEGVRTAGDLRKRLDQLFAREKGLVTLSSIHRAKGLEWDTVVHLDPFRIPSKFARSDAAKQQEWNLKYVCETRAKHTLIEANLEDYDNAP